MKLEVMELVVMQEIRRHGTLNRQYKHNIALELCYRGLVDCSEYNLKKIYMLTEYGAQVLKCNEPYYTHASIMQTIYYTSNFNKNKYYN